MEEEMKNSALRFLRCPKCGHQFNLDVSSTEGNEILTGTLTCTGCGTAYQIVDGVPRFLSGGAYASSFGYEWNRFQSVQLDSRNGTHQSEQALYATTGWDGDDYRGRLVLDAGVGAGRFAEIVAAKGAEVVGVDVTNAVDAAYQNIGRNERVHLVQADIFSMPFAENTFDLAYSIGVLHHTPDPDAAFARVAKTVRPGGGFAVYLYHRYGFGYHVSDFIRKLTTRLPVSVMFSLSALAIPMYPIYRIPVLGKLFHMMLPMSMHPDGRWRWLDTFDWYTPHYQWKLLYPEVSRWYRNNGFFDVEIFDEPIRMRGTKSGTA
jgi:SAM-dependent methyltransferase